MLSHVSERSPIVPEMTYYVFSGTLNPTHFTSLHFTIKLDMIHQPLVLINLHCT